MTSRWTSSCYTTGYLLHNIFHIVFHGEEEGKNPRIRGYNWWRHTLHKEWSAIKGSAGMENSLKSKDHHKWGRVPLQGNPW